MNLIQHSELLSALFGHWPDFHDAELLSLRLDARTEDGPVLEADLEVAEMSDRIDERGYYLPRQKCRTTLRFRSVTGVAMDEFREQNVMDDLVIRGLEPAGAERLTFPWGARRLQVEFIPIAGFCALSFLCDAAEVVRAESTLAAT